MDENECKRERNVMKKEMQQKSDSNPNPVILDTSIKESSSHR